MRLFASKNIGHGIRIGVSEDASRLFGTRHPARAARHVATFDVDLALARATRDSAPTPAARVE